MIYPKFLKEGDTIGFVAPSFGCNIEPYKSRLISAVEKFKDMGYYVNMGPNSFAGEGVGISNTPELCAKELTESYVNQDIDVLFSCGGGELMCETISQVDFVTLKDAPAKWYLGYSDNTNFTFLSATMLDRASIYGPCGDTLGMKDWHESFKNTFDIVTGKSFKVHSFDKYEVESLRNEDNPLGSYNCTEKVDIKCYVMSTEETKNGFNDAGGSFTSTDVMLTDHIDITGRLIGGCLDILSNIAGTRFDYVNQFNDKYAEDGIIWYLEACDLNVFDIRRALWHLEEAGWFKNVKGFIFGRPLNGEPMMNLDHISAVLPYTVSRYKVPVILDADIGHIPPAMPIINGALSRVTYNDGKLEIDMGCEINK